VTLKIISRQALRQILYTFYELNFTFFLISFVKRIQSDVKDGVMRDAKLSQVSLKF